MAYNNNDLLFLTMLFWLERFLLFFSGFIHIAPFTWSFIPVLRSIVAQCPKRGKKKLQSLSKSLPEKLPKVTSTAFCGRISCKASLDLRCGEINYLLINWQRHIAKRHKERRHDSLGSNITAI